MVGETVEQSTTTAPAWIVSMMPPSPSTTCSRSGTSDTQVRTQIGADRDLGRRVGAGRAARGERLLAVAGAVVDADAEAGADRVARHRAAHRAEADDADARHGRASRISEKWITVTMSSSETSRL